MSSAKSTLCCFCLVFACSTNQLCSQEIDDPEASVSEVAKPDSTDSPKKEESKPDKKEEEKAEEIKPPPIGNFSLLPSQQPGMLFGFGGNIIDKGEIQLFLFADEFVGRNKLTIDVLPGILFGVTDDFSIFFNFPFTPLLKDGKDRSSGMEDFFVQLEYAFYNKSTYSYVDQATLVSNVTCPTGSTHKNPWTGFGAPSFFIGSTYTRTTIDWVMFAAPGAILTTSDHGTKAGEQFLYQLGLARNIPSPCGWIYAWMLEIDGQYFKRNRVHGKLDPDSGGNSIFVTPSLWISSKEMIIQFGVSVPINQNLFGHQRKFDYAFNFNFAWSFY